MEDARSLRIPQHHPEYRRHLGDFAYAHTLLSLPTADAGDYTDHCGGEVPDIAQGLNCSAGELIHSDLGCVSVICSYCNSETI